MNENEPISLGRLREYMQQLRDTMGKGGKPASLKTVAELFGITPPAARDMTLGLPPKRVSVHKYAEKAHIPLVELLWACGFVPEPADFEKTEQEFGIDPSNSSIGQLLASLGTMVSGEETTYRRLQEGSTAEEESDEVEKLKDLFDWDLIVEASSDDRDGNYRAGEHLLIKSISEPIEGRTLVFVLKDRTPLTGRVEARDGGICVLKPHVDGSSGERIGVEEIEFVGLLNGAVRPIR